MCLGIRATADDSGLEVDALGGAAGVIGAIYGGRTSSGSTHTVRWAQQCEADS